MQEVTSEYYIAGRGGWADPEGGDIDFYQDMDPDLEGPPGIMMSLGHRKAVDFYDVAGDNAPLLTHLQIWKASLTSQ